MTLRVLLLAASALWCASTVACSDSNGASGADTGVSGSDASTSQVAIKGVVFTVGNEDESAVSGVTITVRNSSPLVQTTSGSDGSFDLQVPANQLVLIELAKDGLLTSIYAVTAPSAGVTGAEVYMLLPSAADGAIETLSLPGRDTSKGIVIVSFDLDDRSGMPAGTEKAEIDASNAGSLVIDAQEDPMRGDTLIANGGDVVVFFNVAPGTTTVTVSGTGCSAELPNSTGYPIEANKVTWVLAHCDAVSAAQPDGSVLDSTTSADGSASDSTIWADGGASDSAAAVDGGVSDGGCSFGEARSQATTGDLDLFGQIGFFNGGEPIPAGTYQIRYVDGCMKYAGSQAWTINARDNGSNTWWLVGETADDRKTILPGIVGYTSTNGAYDDFEACVAASKEIAPTVYTHDGGVLGIWLNDSPYSDNVAGLDGRNPKWELIGLAGCGGDEL